MKAMNLFNKSKVQRTVAAVKSEVNLLRELGWDFEVRHGTYTTKIIKPTGSTSYTTINFRNKVFVAANMVKKDCLESGLSEEIQSIEHSKINYANQSDMDDFQAERVLNIDIKGAYASCLFNSKLITEKTYLYLMSLDKHERLPAVGMLARSYMSYIYSQGKCVSVDRFRADTSEFFFYLIEKIDEMMREIKWMLGEYFIYYWVDGVFFRRDTPVSRIEKVESYLRELNYLYCYESVSNFKFKNDSGMVEISLDKDNVTKQWKFRSSCDDDPMIRTYLNETLMQTHDEN
jgi:hypothetical protein